MFTSLYSHRHQSMREARLCFQTSGTPESTSRVPGVDAINNFFANMLRRAEDVLSPEDARSVATQRNLANPDEWIAAFRNENVFDPGRTDRSAITGRAFGPAQLLSTMTPQDRIREFYAFAASVLPRGSRLIPATPPATLDTPTKTIVLGTVATVMGLRSPDAGSSEMTFAREAFRDIYPEGLDGFIYEDYSNLVREIRAVRLPGGEPSTAQLENREQLLKLAEERSLQMPHGRYRRFIGWLRASEGDPAMSKLVQARLTVLGGQRQRNELNHKENELKTRLMIEATQRGPGEDAERRGRNFMENFGMLEPWQQYAVIGLGLFAAYKLWKKPGRFLGVIPYWTIPTGVVGYYLYRRLFMGDHDAINTITGNVQSGLNQIADVGRNIFNIGVDTTEQRDEKNLAVVSQFLSQQAFLEHFPIAAPMMTVAQIEMRHFAGSAFEAKMAGGGISYSLYSPAQNETIEEARANGRELPRTNNLYNRAQQIIKQRRYNSDTLHHIFHDYNTPIAQSVGNVFYQLAARKQGNRERRDIIEQARLGSATFSRTGTSSHSYDNIRDPRIKAMYVDMIIEGRGIALREHPNKSLVEVIATFVNERQQLPERPDNAERVTVPNMLRPAQIAVLNTRETPLTNIRADSTTLIRNEFQSFLDTWRNPRINVLSSNASDDLKNFADQLLNDPSKPLPEILRILEQVKYAVLVAAAARAGGAPLGVDDVAQMIGAAGSADRLNPVTILASVGRFINDRLQIFSNFQHITSLSQVDTLLQQRFFSGVESGVGRLAALRKQLVTHRARFDRMRNPESAAKIFINALPPAILERFGSNDVERRQRLGDFLRRMIADGPYRTFIDQGEQYYAQRVTNDILIAQITVHQRTGDHRIDTDPNARFVSPIEEQNLIANNEFLLSNILGPSETQPLRGMWAAMNMRQLVTDFRTADFNPNDSASRILAFDQTRQLAWLFVSLQPIGPTAGSTTTASAMSAAAIVSSGLSGIPGTGPTGASSAPRDVVDLHLRTPVRTIALALSTRIADPVPEARVKADALVTTAEKTRAELRKKAEAEAKEVREKGERAHRTAVLAAAQDAIAVRMNRANTQREAAIKTAQQEAKQGLEKFLKSARDAEAALKTAEANRDDARKVLQETTKRLQDAEDIDNAPQPPNGQLIAQLRKAAIEQLRKDLANAAQSEKQAVARLQEATEEAQRVLGQLKQARNDAEIAMNEAIKRADALVKTADEEAQKLLDDVRYGVIRAEALATKLREEAAKIGTPEAIAEARKTAAENLKRAQAGAEKVMSAVENAIKAEVDKVRKALAAADPADRPALEKGLLEIETDAKDTVAKARTETEAAVAKVRKAGEEAVAKAEGAIANAEAESKKILEEARSASFRNVNEALTLVVEGRVLKAEQDAKQRLEDAERTAKELEDKALRDLADEEPPLDDDGNPLDNAATKTARQNLERAQEEGKAIIAKARSGGDELIKKTRQESQKSSDEIRSAMETANNDAASIINNAERQGQTLVDNASLQRIEVIRKAVQSRSKEQNETVYRQGVQDIISTMHLLNMSETDRGLIESLTKMLASAASEDELKSLSQEETKLKDAMAKAKKAEEDRIAKLAESTRTGPILPTGSPSAPTGSPSLPTGSPSAPTGSPAAPTGSPTAPTGSPSVPPPPVFPPTEVTIVPPSAPGFTVTVPPAPGFTPTSLTVIIPHPPGFPPGIPGIIIPPAPGMTPDTPTILVPPAPGFTPATPWINIPPAPGFTPSFAEAPPPPGLTPGAPMIVVPRAPGFPPNGITIVRPPGFPAIVVPPAPGFTPTSPWIVIHTAPGIPASMMSPAPGFTPPIPGAAAPSAPGFTPAIPSVVPAAPGETFVLPPPGILPVNTPLRIVSPPPGTPATMPGIVIPPAPGMPAGTPAIVVPPAPGTTNDTPWLVVPSAPGFVPVTPIAGTILAPGITPAMPMIVVPPTPGIPAQTRGVVILPAPGSPANTPAVIVPPAPGVTPNTPWLVVARAPGIPARFETPAPGFVPPVPGTAAPSAPGFTPSTPDVIPPTELATPPPAILPPGIPTRIVSPAPGIPATMPGIVIPPALGMPAGTPTIVVPRATGTAPNTPWIVVPPAVGFVPVTPAAGTILPPGVEAGRPMIVVPATPGIPAQTLGIVIPPAPGAPAETPTIVILPAVLPAPGTPPEAWVIVPQAPGVAARLQNTAPGFVPPRPSTAPPAPGNPPPTP